jgi:hypothetical protein
MKNTMTMEIKEKLQYYSNKVLTICKRKPFARCIEKLNMVKERVALEEKYNNVYVT